VLLFAPIGSASFHPAAASQLSRILSKRRGLAVALFMIGGTLGSALGPKVGAFVVKHYTIRATVWLIPIGVILAVIMARVLPSGRKEAAKAYAVSSQAVKSRIPRVVGLIMVVSICQCWLELCLQSYYPLLMTGRGESLDRAATVLMLYAMSGAVGAFVGGTLSDRVARWKVLAVGVAGALPLYLGMVTLRGTWLYVMPVLLGMVAAVAHPVTVTMAQELMPDRLALASSLCMGISWVIGSLGAALTGVLADLVGIQPALLVNMVLPLISLAAIAALRRRAGRLEVGAQPA
jgi:MFS transporter, FSR family, fosmidomycin resistance protein